MIYCPYLDKDIDESLASREHIIPMALGGVNGFEIKVSKTENSRLGSEIDAKLADDFLVVQKRNEFDVRGHSNKKPTFKTKTATSKAVGNPLSVEIDRPIGIHIWNPRAQKNTTLAEISEIEFTGQLDLDIDIKFVAKVALSAGYFVYGDLFRHHVKHEELRLIMNNNVSELGEKIYAFQTTADHRFSSDSHPMLKNFRALCQIPNGHSTVGFVPSSNALTIFVGVLGYYMGMLHVPASTEKFPNSGIFSQGQSILLINNQILKNSMYQTLTELERLKKIFKNLT